MLRAVLCLSLKRVWGLMLCQRKQLSFYIEKVLQHLVLLSVMVETGRHRAFAKLNSMCLQKRWLGRIGEAKICKLSQRGCTVDNLHTVSMKFVPNLLAIVLKALELVKQVAVAAVKPNRRITHKENRLKTCILRSYRAMEGIPVCMNEDGGTTTKERG